MSTAIAALAGLVLTAAGVIWGLICRARLADAEHARDEARRERDDLTKRLGISELARSEARSRYEALLADRAKRIATLTEELAAVSPPGATAARLTGFFGGKP